MTTSPSASPAGRRDDAPGSIVPLALIEEYYKQPGHTFLSWLVGADPFDFWIGRYFVGLFGAVSALAAALGTIFYLYAGLVKPNTLNILATNIEPPPIQTGLRLPAPGQPGFLWFIIVVFATIAFVCWGLRQAEISAKLRMSYEVPIGFFAAISAWVTLQWLRPIAMGAWGNGFPLGITAHLDWVSNVGYQYFNFFYNPFHAIAIALFFGSTLLLSMHGSAILSAAPSPNRPKATVDNVDHFWRDILGYSIGEIGIHRLAFWTSAAAVLSADLCIFLSGTFVQNWSSFWRFWDRMPIWSLGGAGVSGIAVYVVGMAIARQPEPADIGEVYGGIESRLGTPYYVGLIDRLFGSGQFGPIYLGVWGTISIVTGCTTIGIILLDYMRQVGYNPVLFVREFAVLGVNPPPPQYGLSFAPWANGGAWLAATFFLHISVLTWWARVYTRARANKLGTHLAWGFAAALSLYFVIYLFRPILLHSWAEAPGHGLKVHLDWVNNVSVRYGNFYYNPFHMISIFFLFGSTLLLCMHGATILGASRYGAEREEEEIELEHSGTHRAQLFWRWTMGFNANALTIHWWAYWFAALCAITGAIGLLISGPVIKNWYEWAITAHIVYR